MKELVTKWNGISLVKRIIAGLIIGIILGMVVPQFSVIGLLGQLFVGALKAVLRFWYSFLCLVRCVSIKREKRQI